jgi:hypothetical protein
MLTEIALPPHTFQPCTIQPNDWAGQLRGLNQRLIHYGSQCPLIFSNLNFNSTYRTANWHAEVRRLVRAAARQHQQLLADLLRLMEGYLVSRPSFGHVRVVADEQHWVREATGQAPGFPIDQLVVTFSGHAAARGVYPNAVCVNRLSQGSFWDAIAFSAYPPMNIQAQIDLLRPVWLHCQTLALALPYALDISDRGEANWFFSLASHAFSRPVTHGEPAIELHVSYDGNGADVLAQGIAHPVVDNFIQQALRQPGLTGHEFSLVVRARSYGSQRFIARRLFAGEEVDLGTGVPDIRVRWGIALEHVALRTDAPNQTAPTFTLLPRQRADGQCRFECRNASPRLLGPVIVRC